VSSTEAGQHGWMSAVEAILLPESDESHQGVGDRFLDGFLTGFGRQMPECDPGVTLDGG
jgi:hypothetical protein